MPSPTAEATCNGKSPFPNQKAAQAAIGRRRRNNKDKAPLHAYRCTVCHDWHVGSSIGRKRRKPVAEITRREMEEA